MSTIDEKLNYLIEESNKTKCDLTGELLWENSEPDLIFGMQTISVPNLNKYNSFKIAFRPKSGLKAYAITQTDGMLYPMSQFCLVYSDSSETCVRIVSVTNDNQIYFTNSVDLVDASIAKNDYCVPIEIYGIEGSLRTN